MALKPEDRITRRVRCKLAYAADVDEKTILRFLNGTHDTRPAIRVAIEGAARAMGIALPARKDGAR